MNQNHGRHRSCVFRGFFVAAMDYTKLLKESSGKTSKVGIVGATRGYAE